MENRPQFEQRYYRDGGNTERGSPAIGRQQNLAAIRLKQHRRDLIEDTTIYNVYVVEDHKEMRDAYSLYLRLAPGMQLCGMTSSAEDALEQIPGANPDLVLVDISLPKMNGIELIRRLQRRCPGLPTLVVSGHGADLYAREALEAGARGYIEKKEVASVMGEAVRTVMRGEVYLKQDGR